MQNGQSSDETLEFFESIKKFIDTLEKSENSERKVNSIVSLIKILVQHFEIDANVSSSQSKSIHSLNQSQQANMEGFIELYERVSTLEKNVADLVSNSSELAKQVMKLAETTKEIPVINVDNLLKTLNQHAEEINQNTAAIKAIKEKI